MIEKLYEAVNLLFTERLLNEKEKNSMINIIEQKYEFDLGEYDDVRR